MNNKIETAREAIEKDDFVQFISDLQYHPCGFCIEEVKF